MVAESRRRAVSLTVVDATGIDGGSIVRCDVCIAGAGAAGITLARELAGTHLDVVLLESGGTEYDPGIDALNDLEFEALPIGPESRVRRLGGTTNSWWGKLAFFDDIDFRARSWVRYSGWPIDAPNLQPYLDRASLLFGTPELARAERESLPPARGPLLTSAELRPTSLFWRRPPLRFADLHTADVRHSRNVTTFLRASLIELQATADGSSLEQMKVRAMDGPEFYVQARANVLACGGIENARLLLASPDPSGNGLGNEFDQVGRYFMEHPKGVSGHIVVTSDAGQLLDRSYWRGRRAGSVKMKRGVCLTDMAQQQEEVLNSCVMLEPDYDARNSQGAEALRTLYRRRFRKLPTQDDVRRIVTDVPKLVGAARFRLLNQPGVRTILLQNFLEQVPCPTNRIRLAEARDKFGTRKASVVWTISELDKRTIGVLHNAIDREVRRRGIGYVESSLLDTDADWTIEQDASHHMGTTRMGRSVVTSVVDADCRMHRIDNLFVAGSSVFPTSGYANPTMMIVALAIRLADHLKQTLS